MERSIDVKTLLLCKIKYSNFCSHQNFFNMLPDNLEPQIHINKFVTIGNYDALLVYPTHLYERLNIVEGNITASPYKILDNFYNEKKVLTTKYYAHPDNSNTGNIFYHPIHIIKHCVNSHERNNVHTFWNKSYPYFAFSVIYGLYNTPVTLTEQKIKVHLQNKVDVQYLIYRSINMAQTILVWKSNKLNEILNAIAEISKVIPNINIHTICGFDYPTIFDPNSTINDLHDEKIDLIKITGTVRSFEYMSETIRDIKNILLENTPESNRAVEDTDYLAFGNNDYNLIYKNIPIKNLLKLLRSWLNNADSFNRYLTLKTRIHTSYSLPSSTISSNHSIPPSPLSKIDQLVNYSQYIILEGYSEYNWAYPFIETLNMLKDMCHSPTLSRIQYFIADSLYCFSHALNYIYSQFNSKEDVFYRILSYNEKTINKYTVNFNTLINQLVRVDSYLSQEPGYSPLIYNMIPASILEYYYSFVYHLIDFMKKYTLDSSDIQLDTNIIHDVQYSLLLIPKLARSIKIDNVLHIPLEAVKPVFPYYQVYHVEIPYDMLYKPKNTLCVVTHEIMHFCGENIRFRNIRYECFLASITALLINDWKLEDAPQEAFDFVLKTFQDHIKLSQVGIYLETLTDSTILASSVMYNDIDFRNKLFSLYEKNMSSTKSRISIIKSINTACFQQAITARIPTIAEYYKECYADIMMFCILKIDAKIYLNMINDEIEKSRRNRSHESANVIQAFFTQRVAIVFHLAAKILGYTDLIDELSRPNSPDFYACVKVKIEDIEKALLNDYEKENSSDDIPIKSLLHIYDYLKKCCLSFKEILSKKKDDIKIIADSYSLCMDDQNMFNNYYCNIIVKNRERINSLLENGNYDLNNPLNISSLPLS